MLSPFGRLAIALTESHRCRARHLDSEPLEKPAVGQPDGAVAVKVKANTCLLFGASDALFGPLGSVAAECR